MLSSTATSISSWKLRWHKERSARSRKKSRTSNRACRFRKDHAQTNAAFSCIRGAPRSILERGVEPLRRTQESLRIDGFASDPGLVVQMRTRRSSACAEPADDLPVFDALPDAHVNRGQ